MNSVNTGLLMEMKARVENLWQDILHCPNESERIPLREKYREEYAHYKRQLLLLEKTADETEISPVAFSPGARPDVFKFMNYQDFLRAWFEYLSHEGKLNPEKISKRLLNKELQDRLTSKSRLAPAVFLKILPLIGLTATESAAIQLIYLISESDSAEKRYDAMTRLQGLPGYRKTHPNEAETWRYLTHWYYIAIRELATLSEFKVDAEWIQQRLNKRVPLNEIRKALLFLSNAGFIKVENGEAHSLLKYVSCSGGVFRYALAQFHKEMLAMTSDAIFTIPSQERYITGHTVALSDVNFEKAKQIIDEARAKIEALDAGERSNDRVYHFGLSAIPLTGGSN